MLGKLQAFFSFTGYCLSLLARALTYTPRVFFRWKALVREMWIIGVQSLPLACFFLLLMGMVFALVVGSTLVNYGSEGLVGQIVATGMISQLGPLMTAIVLIARNGSSMAAELGTMSVSEEVAALNLMSVAPEDYLVMPRIWAFVLVAPMLTVVSTLFGILGGALVSIFQLDVAPLAFRESVMRGLEPPLQIYWSMLRAEVYAITTVAVACAFGLRTRGGALGVGQASRDTVVVSLVLVVFFNFILESFYQITLKLIES